MNRNWNNDVSGDELEIAVLNKTLQEESNEERMISVQVDLLDSDYESAWEIALGDF